MDRQGGDGCSEQPGTTGAHCQSGQPAEAGKHHRFAHKEPEDLALAGANRPQQADLRTSLGDGDGHDGKDANPPHQQGDTAECADGEGQNVEHPAEGVEHLILGGDGEIFIAVALFQQLAQGFCHRFTLVAR